jgi:hypothetical protein
MSHLSMESLLALREPGTEPGAAAAREHIDGCSVCQAELDRLHQRVARLKALPALRPSRSRWPDTATSFRGERLRKRLRHVGLAGLTAAASIFAVTRINLTPPVEPDSNQISEVMQRSQALESALSELNPDGRVVDGRTARIAQELEDRIARLDRQLEVTDLSEQQARDAELLRLWRERVGLLDALVDVHVTRASDAGL